MIALYILMIVCGVVIVGTLSWYAMQDQNLRCTNNGCTGDCDQGRNCSCVTIVPEINPSWPFPTQPKP